MENNGISAADFYWGFKSCSFPSAHTQTHTVVTHFCFDRNMQRHINKFIFQYYLSLCIEVFGI